MAGDFRCEKEYLKRGHVLYLLKDAQRNNGEVAAEILSEHRTGEDPGRPDTHDKPFDGSPERDHDTDDSVEHYGNELSALRKWVSLDPARIQPTRCIRRRLCST